MPFYGRAWNVGRPGHPRGPANNPSCMRIQNLQLCQDAWNLEKSLVTETDSKGQREGMEKGGQRMSRPHLPGYTEIDPEQDKGRPVLHHLALRSQSHQAVLCSRCCPSNCVSCGHLSPNPTIGTAEIMMGPSVSCF